MANVRAVYRVLNRPLTVLGVETNLFLLAAGFGALTFEATANLFVAVVVTAVLLVAARIQTAADHQFLNIIRRSLSLASVYDPFVIDPKALGRYIPK